MPFQLNQLLAKHITQKKKKRISRDNHWNEFLRQKQEDDKYDIEDFKFGNRQYSKLIRGSIVSDRLARAFVMFALEIAHGSTELGRSLRDDSGYDYGWAVAYVGLSIDEAMNRMFTIPQQTAFWGTFYDAVQLPILRIEKAILDAINAGVDYRFNEHHTWCKNADDAEATSIRMTLTAGSHQVPPEERPGLNDEQRMKLALEAWPFDCSPEDLNNLFRFWFEQTPYAHVWAVDPDAKPGSNPWKVRSSNMTTLPLIDDAYTKIRTGRMGLADLTDPSLFQIPTTQFFIAGCAEHPNSDITGAAKSLAEMSAFLCQLAHLVPPVSHEDHGKTFQLLSFGGTPETQKTLESKGFIKLNDILKDTVNNRPCHLYEMTIGRSPLQSALKNLIYSRAKNAVYEYRAHLDYSRTEANHDAA